MANAPVRDQLADHRITSKNAALILIDYRPRSSTLVDVGEAPDVSVDASGFYPYQLTIHTRRSNAATDAGALAEIEILGLELKRASAIYQSPNHQNQAKQFHLYQPQSG